MAARTSILVTGGAGFIGSNFVPFFCAAHPEYEVINLDKLTYAGNLAHLTECEHLDNYRFVQGDITDETLLTTLFAQYDIRGVIHFAAESHVDNSITGPQEFINTNIVGTFKLLQSAYHHWFKGPNQVKAGYEHCRFHHISTDEVYGSLGATGLFTEQSPYNPSSPYSASKASSDLLVKSYHRTYGLNTTISNCSNNYGPKQHREKLIPKTILHCLQQKEIPIYGQGKNVRDWLYVLDHCRAIDLIFHQGHSGETYNVGGQHEVNNITLVRTICQLLDEMHPLPHGKHEQLIAFVTDRAGHDFRYAIDFSKLQQSLGWQPQETFVTGLRKTIAWYIQHT